jgi:hypothetical protein
MTLYGVMPTFNEESRYLGSALANVMPIVDQMFVWDDRSTDDSVEIARSLGACVAARPEGSESFVQHEGRFRQLGWDTFEVVVKPSVGDWVLAIDADEVLVTTGTNCCVRCEIDQAIQAAESIGAKAVVLPIPEVFGFDNDTPLVRTDGQWGNIRGSRLFRYEPGGRFADRPMGCGSEPGYIQSAPMSHQTFGLHLMHLGYARERDQIDKHRRYSSLAAHGHLDSHVQSIVGPKTLKRWDGPVPEMLRGDERVAA